jgi:hypothetical protein
MSATTSAPSSPLKPSVPAVMKAKRYDPNPHPYAIKTTSTGLLSRSNSTTQHLAKHQYVPPSPSPSPHARGHRSAKSLDTHEFQLSSPGGRPLPTPPRPLPAPPGSTEADVPVAAEHTPSRRVRPRRSDTMPASLDASGLVVAEDQGELPDLPADAKLWTPSQVAAYLSGALRVHSGGHDDMALPPPVARDIAAFVRAAKMTGRVFLRLSDDHLDE